MTEKDKYQNSIFFPIGEENPYGELFVGQSYLAPVSTEQVPVFNVTFEPGCRNNWHIHHAKAGGGQMLICIGGRGYYQEWGKEAVEMTPGTVINIPAEVKHWHGLRRIRGSHISQSKLKEKRQALSGLRLFQKTITTN